MTAALLLAFTLTSAEAADGVGVAAGVHVGPAFTLTPLSTGVLPRFELAAVLPVADRRVQPYLTGTYLTAKAEGTVEDSRVAGGSYTYTLTQRETTIGAGVTVRALPWTARLNPELTIGPQLYMLASRADGDAEGNAFGETNETYSRLGVLVAPGVGLRVGPGVLTGHIVYSASPLDGVLTGDSSTAAVTPSIGFRMHLPSFEPVAATVQPVEAPNPDRDGDTVANETDLCPDVPGAADFEGCPDTDGDGVIDPDDQCPQQAGPIAQFGCPDPPAAP